MSDLCPECSTPGHDSFCLRPYREKMQELAATLADVGAQYEPEPNGGYGKVLVPLSDEHPNRIEMSVSWRTDISGERPYVRVASYALVTPLHGPEELHRMPVGDFPSNLVADKVRELAEQWSER